MLQVIFILIAFLCGSLPFSIWLGKAMMGLDVRHFGDGNPGAANVYRAGNKLAGLLTLMLDISKAAIPVGLAYHNLGIRGVSMYFIAIAPILGHVFSPFLGFRGGKGLSVALGIWIGLTVLEGFARRGGFCGDRHCTLYLSWLGGDACPGGDPDITASLDT